MNAGIRSAVRRARRIRLTETVYGDEAGGVTLSPRACEAFRAAGAARGITDIAVAAKVLSTVARDRLIDAVLDDAQPRAASTHAVRKERKGKRDA